MITKEWIERIVREEEARQCKRNAACRRLDKHDGDCKTFAVLLAEKIERAAVRIVTRIRGAS